MLLSYVQKRLLCTTTQNSKWNVKQVMKSNFSESLEEIEANISRSQYVSISIKNTGSFSSSWHRVLPFDTSEIAYCKAKYEAERFQVLQFALCPFSIKDSSTVVAYPYNFHLFPRDEFKMGMPSYSFSCQAPCLMSMARGNFDFNVCINDGISYLSQVQESAIKVQMGNVTSGSKMATSPLMLSVSDTLFVERIKSRLKNWRNACKDLSMNNDGENTVKSIRKIVLGVELYGSRPCLNIDVCSERQVQLLIQMLKEFAMDLVPLVLRRKGGEAQTLCVVFTNSDADKDSFEKEIQKLEEEQNKRIRGFREVIELLSSSRKPIVSCKFLKDFLFIHSKFLAPLPLKRREFMFSLKKVFPCTLDINLLIKNADLSKEQVSLAATGSCMKRMFITPIHMKLPHAAANEGNKHGRRVLRISHLFGRLAPALSINTEHGSSCLVDAYTREFSEHTDETIQIWRDDTRKVSFHDLLFVWGFEVGMTAKCLKNLLEGLHGIFNSNFDVRMVDQSCALVVFWQSELSRSLLKLIQNEGIGGGLNVSSYEAYERVCKQCLWGTSLADSFSLLRETSES